MPELAEVETFKRQLEPLLVGHKIVFFEATHPRSIRRHIKAESITARILGKEITSLIRHGKYLAIEMETGDYLNIHLRMSGRILVFGKNDYNPKNNPKHSHVVFETTENSFVFVDPRTFGEMWLTSGQTEEMKKGIDAFDATETERSVLFESLSKTSRSVKSILLDQKYLSGIGNIYADEICANARINPTRSFKTLTKGEISRLSRSCGKVLADAIFFRGSSLRDESFKDLYGEIGLFQNKHVVHAKKHCSNCDGPTTRTKIAGRSSYYCVSCQK